MRILVLLFTLVLSRYLSANDQEGWHPSKEFRIERLLPMAMHPLAVEPALPENYIAMSPNGNFDLYEGYYWGPKEVLEAFFKDRTSLTQPIIRVKLSFNVKQTGPDSFDGQSRAQFERMMKKFNKTMSVSLHHWGAYPVFATKADSICKKFPGMYLAWIGLCDPDGWVLLLDLYCPANGTGRPSEKDVAFWDTFLNETRQLEERDCVLVNGQDMQLGYTLVKFPGGNNEWIRVKASAEKRIKDGCIQVVMKPISSNVIFEYTSMSEGRSGLEWIRGAPMVKVKGSYVQKHADGQQHIQCVTSILLKEVDEFSVNADDVKGQKDIFVYQKKQEGG